MKSLKKISEQQEKDNLILDALRRTNGSLSGLSIAKTNPLKKYKYIPDIEQNILKRQEKNSI